MARKIAVEKLTELLNCPDLQALARRASSSGLTASLATPLRDWRAEATLSARAAEFVDRHATPEGWRTLGDLLDSQTAAAILGKRAMRGVHTELLAAIAFWLAAEAPAEPTRASSAEVVPSRLRAGMDAAALRSWAASRLATHWLDVRASVLDRVLDRPTSAWLWGHRGGPPTLEAVITSRTSPAGRLARPGEAPIGAQQAAIDLLEREAQQIQAAVAEEASRPGRRPPEDPTILEAWERLDRARTELRATLPPRAKASIGRLDMSVDVDPPRLRVCEHVHAACGGTQSPRLAVELRPAAGVPVISCGCSGSRSGRCGIALSTLDLALDLLSEPGESPVAREMARALKTPAWSRTLDELDRVLGTGGASTGRREGAPGPSDGAPGWRVEMHRLGQLLLYPVRVLPRARGGGWKGGPITWREFRAEVARSEDRTDVILADLLCPDGSDFSPATRSSYGGPARAAVHRALDMLIGHPRVLLAKRGGDVLLTVRRGNLELSIEAGDDGTSEARLLLDGRPITPSDLATGSGGRAHGGSLVILDEGRADCAVVPVSAAAEGLIGVLSRRGGTFPKDALPEIATRIPQLLDAMPVRLGQALRGERVEASTRPVLRLAVLDGDALRADVRLRPLAGGPVQIPGAGQPEIYGTHGERRVYAARDLAGEAAVARAFADGLGLPPETEVAPFRFEVHDLDAALDLLVTAREAADRVDVEWATEARRQVSRPASAKDLVVHLTSATDWFGASGGLEVDGEDVPLQALLAAAREGRRYVRATSGTWVALERRLRDHLDTLADTLAEDRRGLRISPLHAPAVRDLAAEGARVEAPRAWAELLDRIERAGEVDPSPPPGLDAELRPYQREGQAWLARLAAWGAGACLADDMGLGKTVQALALLVRRGDLGPALVVAPTSVGFNWVRECERFAPGLRPRLHRGPGRQARLADLGSGDVVVTSYDLLLRDVDGLAAIDWATLVLDEAQAVKNPETRRAKAVRALKASFRMALTGTPLENRLGDLWSLFDAIAPGLLGDAHGFRTRFAVPMERDGDEGRRAALARLTRPFLLRRTKAEVAPELPPRTEVTLEVDLSAEERRLYERFRLAALKELQGAEPSGNEQTRRIQVLAVLTRLRQLACHPRLFDPESPAPSAKMAELRDLVAELRSEGHRALVFSQFTRHLDLVEEALGQDGVRCRRIDGSTPEARRRAEIDAFQAGEGDVFLISLKAGGIGLNLTAATYVIHLDPWWNPAVEDQATGRAHRIGQSRPVTVYRLVSRGTVEEAILALHGRKRALVEGVLDGTDAAGALSAEELVRLVEGAGGDGMEDGEHGPPAGERGGAPAEEVEADARGPAGLNESTRTPGVAVPRKGAPGTPAAGPTNGETRWRAASELPALVDDYQVWLDRQANARVLSPGTATSYGRLARRFCEYVGARATVPLSPDDLEAWVDRAAADSLAGRGCTSSSQVAVMRSAVRRLQAFWEG